MPVVPRRPTGTTISAPGQFALAASSRRISAVSMVAPSPRRRSKAPGRRRGDAVRQHHPDGQQVNLGRGSALMRSPSPAARRLGQPPLCDSVRRRHRRRKMRSVRMSSRRSEEATGARRSPTPKTQCSNSRRAGSRTALAVLVVGDALAGLELGRCRHAPPSGNPQVEQTSRRPPSREGFPAGTRWLRPTGCDRVRSDAHGGLTEPAHFIGGWVP